jgi:hypothetical protein
MKPRSASWNFKKLFLLILLTTLVGGFSISSNAQNSLDLFGQVGLNRIGVGTELGARFAHQKHNFQVGLRLYEPDLVFEKNTLGTSLAYFYSFRTDRQMKLNIGLGSSFFFEKKGTSHLMLIDPKILVQPNWLINNKMTIQLSGGIGPTINHITSELPINQKNFVYLNYEMAIAVYYRLWNSPKL